MQVAGPSAICGVPNQRCARAVAFCVLAALAVRLPAAFIAARNEPWGDERAQLADAWDWVANGEQHVFWPPVTGWIAGGVFSLTGYSVPAARLVWMVLDCLNIVVIFFLFRRLFGSSVAFWTSLICAFYPLAVIRGVYVTSEVPAMLFAQLGLLALVAAVSAPADALSPSPTDTSRKSAAFALFAGFAFAVSALSRGAMLALLPLFSAAMLLPSVCPGGVLVRARHAALVALGGVIVLLPWAMRNYAASGQWVFICTNSSYNLQLGTVDGGHAPDAQFLFRPRATSEQRLQRQAFMASSLGLEPAKALNRFEMGPSELASPPQPATTPQEEFTRHREARAAARQRIQADVDGFLVGMLGRFARCWALDTEVKNLFGREVAGGIFRPGPLMLTAASNAFFVSGMLLGLVGLFSKQRVSLMWVAGLYVLGPILVYALIHGKPRYHLGAMPVLFAFAVWTVLHLSEIRQSMTRWRLIAVACTFAFLIWTWAAWTLFCVTSRGMEV